MNKRIIIVGGGASVRQDKWDTPVKELPLWYYLLGEATISLNYVFRYLEPTFACFHDETFYRSNLKELATVPLIIGNYARNVEDVIMPNTYLVKNRSDWCENQWQEGFYGSNLVGVLALSIAINLGYKEIFLVGYDFGMLDGLHTHFYQDEVDLNEKDCNLINSKYRGVGKLEVNGKLIHKTANYEHDSSVYFKPFQNYKSTHEIINVGLTSKLNEFPKISFEEFYERLDAAPSNVNQEIERKAIEEVFLSKRIK